MNETRETILVVAGELVLGVVLGVLSLPMVFVAPRLYARLWANTFRKALS